MTGVGFPRTSSNLRDNTMKIAATVFFAGAWLRVLPDSMFGLIVTGGGRGGGLWASRPGQGPSIKKIKSLEVDFAEKTMFVSIICQLILCLVNNC